MDTSSEAKIIFSIIKYAVLAIFALIIILGSFVTIATGEVGVKTRLGKVVGTVDAGFHFKLPVLEKVTKLEVRNRVVKNEHYVNEKGEVISDNALTAASIDQQNVNVSTTVNYSIDQSKIIDLYTKYRTVENFEEGVVKPAIKQVVKTETAKYAANDLTGKREELNARVSEALRLALSDNFAVVEQSNVTNIEFSDAYTQAIEKKVTAEQDALTAKNTLAKTEYEGQQKIVSAKAEAEAIRIQSQAINSQGGADYVNLQLIQKWKGDSCTTNCYTSMNSLPLLNTGNK